MNSYFPQPGLHGQLGVSAAKSVVRAKRKEAESVTMSQEDQAHLVATATTTAQEDQAKAQLGAAVEMIQRQNLARIKNVQVHVVLGSPRSNGSTKLHTSHR